MYILRLDYDEIDFIEPSQELFDPIYPHAINVVLFSDPMNTIQREISAIPATQRSLPFMVAFSLHVRKQNERKSLLLLTYSTQRKYCHKHPTQVQSKSLLSYYSLRAQLLLMFMLFVLFLSCQLQHTLQLEQQPLLPLFSSKSH